MSTGLSPDVIALQQAQARLLGTVESVRDREARIVREALEAERKIARERETRLMEEAAIRERDAALSAASLERDAIILAAASRIEKKEEVKLPDPVHRFHDQGEAIRLFDDWVADRGKPLPPVHDRFTFTTDYQGKLVTGNLAFYRRTLPAFAGRRWVDEHSFWNGNSFYVANYSVQPIRISEDGTEIHSFVVTDVSFLRLRIPTKKGSLFHYNRTGGVDPSLNAWIDHTGGVWMTATVQGEPESGLPSAEDCRILRYCFTDAYGKNYAPEVNGALHRIWTSTVTDGKRWVFDESTGGLSYAEPGVPYWVRLFERV